MISIIFPNWLSKIAVTAYVIVLEYGAPFVTSLLLSTAAMLSRQKSKMWHLASGYAMCNTQVPLSWQKYFCPTKVTFVWQKYFWSNKNYFCLTKVILSTTKVILSDNVCFCQQKYGCYKRRPRAPFVTSILLKQTLSRQKSKMWHLASGYAMCYCDRVTYRNTLNKNCYTQTKLVSVNIL